jgi:hypothetical protein
MHKDSRMESSTRIEGWSKRNPKSRTSLVLESTNGSWKKANLNSGISSGGSWKKANLNSGIPPTKVRGSLRSGLIEISGSGIPPTEVGGWLTFNLHHSVVHTLISANHLLSQPPINKQYLSGPSPPGPDFNDPPTSVGGIRKRTKPPCRLDFNDPPTSVGGIPMT